MEKPNAFVFKVLIDGEYRVCVCPRIDNKWSEKDIVYISDYDGRFDDVLDNKLFSVIFVGCQEDPTGIGGFTIKNVNSQFLKSDTQIAEEMYRNGTFFTTIEKGYQTFYESERQGEQTTSSEEKSV